MGIQINGQTDRISAVDGSFSIQDLAEVNVTGVATASNFKSGTSNVHSTGYECTNINATGIVTAASANFTGNVSVGGTLTYQDVTNIDSVGVVTARAGVHVTGGDLGVGTNNPFNATGYKSITLAGSTGGAIAFREGATTRWEIYGDNSNGIRFYDRTNTTERVRITSAGQMGLGTNSPGSYDGEADNFVVASSDHTGITIASTGSNKRTNLYFADGTSGDARYRGAFTYDHNGDYLQVRTAGSERLRISSSGLAINKSAAADAEIEILQSADPTLRLHDTRNAAYKADFLMAGSAPLIRNNNSTASDRTFVVQKGLTDHLIIEGTGAVRKPLSPSFSANLSSGNLNAATHNNVIIFNNEHFDKSNSYDASNGRFTAPVAGTYYFGVQIYAGFALNGVRVLHAKFVKNGSDVASCDMFGGASDHGGTSYHPTGCGHFLTNLAVNDWIAFSSGGFSGSGSGHATIYAANGTRFFGYLVG